MSEQPQIAYVVYTAARPDSATLSTPPAICQQTMEGPSQTAILQNAERLAFVALSQIEGWQGHMITVFFPQGVKAIWTGQEWKEECLLDTIALDSRFFMAVCSEMLEHEPGAYQAQTHLHYHIAHHDLMPSATDEVEEFLRLYPPPKYHGHKYILTNMWGDFIAAGSFAPVWGRRGP